MGTQVVDGTNPLFLHDMDKLCGICLRKLSDKDKLRLLTDKIPNSKPVTDVSDVLKSISRFTSENGPTSICPVCYQNVGAAYRFQILCNQSQEYIDAYLQHQLAMELKKEDEADQTVIEIIVNEDCKMQNREEEVAVIQVNEVKSDNVTRVKCKVCHKLYRADYLRVHMRMHTGEKPYQCDICKKSFAQPTSLKQHIRFHKEEREYMCNHCGKAFKVLGNLKIHMRSHTGERPYRCDVCGMSFTNHSARNRHVTIHTGEKDYTCDVCAKSFNRISNMRVHYKIHTNDKRFVCNICSKAFIQAHSLRSHLKTHSNRDVVGGGLMTTSSDSIISEKQNISVKAEGVMIENQINS